MKLFGRFKAKTAAPPPATYGIPTVKAGPELFVAYRDVFDREMPQIAALSTSARKAIYEYISKGEGGYLNQGRYHTYIFETYFKNAEWRWPEYDRWQARFLARGAWPVRWPQKYRCAPSFADDAAVLAYRKHLYAILMNTINFRAKHLSDHRRQVELGLQRELALVFPEDRPFVDLALADDPNALSPFFPFDLSRYKPIVPGFT